METTEVHLDGRDLAPGVYFVKAPGYKSAKIVKTGGVR
jgi:hypothetical protein